METIICVAIAAAALIWCVWRITEEGINVRVHRTVKVEHEPVKELTDAEKKTIEDANKQNADMMAAYDDAVKKFNAALGVEVVSNAGE